MCLMDEREYQQRICACAPALYRTARAILSNEQDCADAVQEAVFQGWIKRSQLRDADRFCAWMGRITINECRNLQRRSLKQRRAVEASLEALRQPPPRKVTELEAAVSLLPEKYRLPIVLYYAQRYTTGEIARMLDMPESRLRERLRTARKMLGRMLKHEAE